MYLKNQELVNISAGGITATMLNALSRACSFLLKFGQTIGTVIRRKVTGTYCIG